MKFMMIVKASRASEAGEMPSEDMIAAMTKYNEELVKAGVLLDATGLQPSSKGARIRYSGGKRLVLDGPFAESKELIAGYWIIKADSLAQAIEWAKKAPMPHYEESESEIEVRQYFELEDFGESPAVEKARELEAKLARRQK